MSYQRKIVDNHRLGKTYRATRNSFIPYSCGSSG